MLEILFDGLLVAAVIFAAMAAYSRDLLKSVIFLSGTALCTATIFLLLNAPDIAITKAAVEAGVTTAIFIAVLQKTSRYEEKTGKDSGKKAAKPASGQEMKK